jgi:hypothetical protein
MHHPRAGGVRRTGDGTRARALYRVKPLGAALGQDADQVDGDVGIPHR